MQAQKSRQGIHPHTAERGTMHAMSIESSQSGRSAAAVPSFKESNYVGLTLEEFHSPANLKESLDLMLSFDISKSPASHPPDMSQEFIQHRLGLPVQGGIIYRPDQGYHQPLPMVSSTCSSAHLPAPSGQMLVEWKDTESMVEDFGGVPICMKDTECFRDLLADLEDKERKEQEQEQVQNQDPFNIPHSFSMISQATGLHGWADNGGGDPPSRFQSDLLGRVQFTPHCHTFSCNIYGSSAGARHSRSPAGKPVQCASCHVPSAGFDPSFCAKVGYSSLVAAAAENQTPPSESTRGNLVKVNSAPSPAAEVFSSQVNDLMRHSSMNAQLKVGLNTSEVTEVQGAKASLPSHDQKVQLLPSTLIQNLPDQNSKHEAASASSPSREDSQKANTGMHVNTTYGLRNMMLGPIKLPPLDFGTTVMGQNVRLAAAADGRSPQNKGKSLEEKSIQGLTYTRAEASPLSRNLPIIFRAKSAPAAAYNPEPFGKLSTAGVQLSNGNKCNDVEGRNVNVISLRNKTPPSRRSRFDRRLQACTFVSERLRREKLTESYNTLKSLLRNFNKSDRASILEETIAQVKHLQNKKTELEKLKQEKLMKLKRQRAEVAKCQNGVEHEESGEGNCQWLKKTSRHGTEVDMRIFQDEIHVSIVQKHLPRFLLRMVTALETQLKLDIMNATGSVIDGFDVYNFKVKIRGNSCVLANDIMAKIIDTLDSVF